MNSGLLGFPKRRYAPGIVFLGKHSFRSDVGKMFQFRPDIDEYELVVNNLVQSASASVEALVARFLIGGTLIDTSAIYADAVWTWTPSATAAFGASNNTAIYITTPDNDANYGGSGVMTIFLNNRGLYTQSVSHDYSRDQNRGADEPQGHMFMQAYRSTRRPSGIYVFGSGGVIISGEALMYGYNRS